MPSEQLLALIDAIYSAAADPSQWPHVAQQIQHAIGGHSVNLALEDLPESKVNIVFTNGVTADQIQHYQQDVVGQDKLTDLLDVVPECSAFLSQDYYDLNAIRSMYCYEAFYEKVGYSHFNAGLFYRNNGRRAWISVARSEADSLFEAEEYQLMQALTPHLRRAFLINLQLAEAQLTSKVALDSLEHIAAAAMILTPRGRVSLHNCKAEPYLHRVGSSDQSITVRLPDIKANRQLYNLVASVINNELNQNGFVPFFDNGVQKTAICFPWRSSPEQLAWLQTQACCIVFILSPSNDTPEAALLQNTFQLSNSEVKVLGHLMEGMQVSEIAASVFVTEATIRFHIRNLLRKTKTRTQAELVAKVFDTTSMRVR